MAKSKDPAQIARGPEVSGIPRYFGKGKHKVQLAYITDPEAGILKALDIHNSNPPHTGPSIKNIPNYNDFGSDDKGGTTGGGGGDRREGGVGGDGGRDFNNRMEKARVTFAKKQFDKTQAQKNLDKKTADDIATRQADAIKKDSEKQAQIERDTEAANKKRRDEKAAAEIAKRQADAIAADAAAATELDRMQLQSPNELFRQKLAGGFTSGKFNPKFLSSANKKYYWGKIEDGTYNNPFGQSVSNELAADAIKKLRRKYPNLTNQQLLDLKGKTYRGLLGDVKTDLSLDGDVLGSLSLLKKDGFLDSFSAPTATTLLSGLLGFDPTLNSAFTVNKTPQELERENTRKNDENRNKVGLESFSLPYENATIRTGDFIDENSNGLDDRDETGASTTIGTTDPYNLQYSNLVPTTFNNTGYMDYLNNIGNIPNFGNTNNVSTTQNVGTSGYNYQDFFPAPVNVANGGMIPAYGHGGMTGFVDEPISIMYMGNEDEVANTGISGILEKYRQIRSTL